MCAAAHACLPSWAVNQMYTERWMRSAVQTFYLCLCLSSTLLCPCPLLTLLPPPTTTTPPSGALKVFSAWGGERRVERECKATSNSLAGRWTRARWTPLTPPPHSRRRVRRRPPAPRSRMCTFSNVCSSVSRYFQRRGLWCAAGPRLPSAFHNGCLVSGLTG